MARDNDDDDHNNDDDGNDDDDDYDDDDDDTYIYVYITPNRECRRCSLMIFVFPTLLVCEIQIVDGLYEKKLSYQRWGSSRYPKQECPPLKQQEVG